MCFFSKKIKQAVLMALLLSFTFAGIAQVVEIPSEEGLIAVDIKASGNKVSPHQLSIKIKPEKILVVNAPGETTYEGQPLRYSITAQAIKPSNLPVSGINIKAPIAMEIRMLAGSGKNEKEVQKFGIIGENGKWMKIAAGDKKSHVQLDILAEKLAF